ncbi:Replication-relaxation [Streptomyces sp. 3213]|uniref:replication-relaxation family protein n=1 Tax=Streptomyces sp. 3213.3 TaxID=1855348 RepID=UPI0008990F3B|nr:replication-relaxation family protein [Streptomyces sp. 3213.3]SEC16280.1 Replication-relaxation [Streptomyces sp. 3213] [Streptomyces sp. 3213.3]
MELTMEQPTAQPSDRTTAGFTPSPVKPLIHQPLATLPRHRMASTPQLPVLIRPDRSRQSVSQRLNQPLGKHLAGFVVLPQPHRTRVWFPPPKGARLTRDWPALRGRPPYPITSATAAPPKTPHTPPLSGTHLEVVAHACPGGNAHGHLDWTPEVFHPIGDGDKAVADAFMTSPLPHSQQRRKLRAFIEIGPATTSSARLTAQLTEYTRLRPYEPQPAGAGRTGPGSRRRYPVVPRILFVLTGAGRQAIDNRISNLKAIPAHHPLIADLVRKVPLGAVVLEDLGERGATCDVWVPPAGGEPRPRTGL